MEPGTVTRSVEPLLTIMDGVGYRRVGRSGAVVPTGPAIEGPGWGARWSGPPRPHLDGAHPQVVEARPSTTAGGRLLGAGQLLVTARGGTLAVGDGASFVAAAAAVLAPVVVGVLVVANVVGARGRRERGGGGRNG